MQPMSTSCPPTITAITIEIVAQVLGGKFDSMHSDFHNLVQRLYQGDAAAAEQIVRDHEPEIRRIVRSRLRDPKLRRIVDSIDICQSVFGRFFVQATLGRFKLNSQSDLVKLLTRMATNKIIDKHRAEDSQRRLSLHKAEYQNGNHQFGEPVQPQVPPESNLVFQEMLSSASSSLTESEKTISELRNQGLSWLEVSRKMGESPQALRKRLERACNRIAKEIGID